MVDGGHLQLPLCPRKPHSRSSDVIQDERYVYEVGYLRHGGRFDQYGIAGCVDRCTTMNLLAMKRHSNRPLGCLGTLVVGPGVPGGGALRDMLRALGPGLGPIDRYSALKDRGAPHKPSLTSQLPFNCKAASYDHCRIPSLLPHFFTPT